MRIVILLLVAVAFAAAVTVANADGPSYYKLIINNKAVYGTVVDDTHFQPCGRPVIEKAAGVKPILVSGSCPSSEGPFVPFAGHLKHASPKPTPRHTPPAS